MREKTDLSILIPCHDEAESIPELISQLRAAFPPSGGTVVDFIVVDDASEDGSYEILERCRDTEPRIKAVRRSARGGQSAALWDGLRRADGEWIAHLDCDLQNDPADLPWMLEKAKEGYDAVIGYRLRRRDSLSRRVAGRFANVVRRAVLGDHIRDIGCSIRIVRRETLEAIPPLAEAHRYLPALLEKSGAKIVQVATNHRDRRYGFSKYDNLRRGLRGVPDLVRMARYIRQIERTRNGGDSS